MSEKQDELTADEVAHLFNLEPLPDEGGRWARTLNDGSSSAIHYLLSAGDFSAMHRLDSSEIYHHYAGAPAVLLLLFPDYSAVEMLLAGQRPQIVVPAGTWQGSLTLGDWTLLGTTMSPPYCQEGFELGKREHLITGWSLAAERIIELTRF